MSNKFTEEQYQKIITYWDNEPIYTEATEAVISYVSRTSNNSFEQALLLAIPESREWAHDNFVEKEKKYYWNTKKKNEYGHSMNLLHGAGGVVQMMGPKDALTESEIRQWGYNPEMFDRYEV